MSVLKEIVGEVRRMTQEEAQARIDLLWDEIRQNEEENSMKAQEIGTLTREHFPIGTQG